MCAFFASMSQTQPMGLAYLLWGGVGSGVESMYICLMRVWGSISGLQHAHSCCSQNYMARPGPNSKGPPDSNDWPFRHVTGTFPSPSEASSKRRTKALRPRCRPARHPRQSTMGTAWTETTPGRLARRSAGGLTGEGELAHWERGFQVQRGVKALGMSRLVSLDQKWKFNVLPKNSF